MTSTVQVRDPVVRVEPRAGGRHRRSAPLRTALLGWWLGPVPLALLVLGAAIRVRQWAAGRSLWLDEALLARSLVERGHLGLAVRPLDHNQAAPMLWLQAERLVLDALGTGERALRLLPLLGGLLGLVLAAQLTRRLLPPVLVPVAVGLVALSPSLVYYSNELKPYSWDVAVTLALVLVALRCRPAELGLAGAGAVWAAFPAVFVLAGASLVLVLRRQPLGARARATLALLPWLVSLAVEYVLLLHRAAGNDLYARFWSSAYPTGAQDLPHWLGDRATALAGSPLHLALTPVAIGLLAYGAARLVVRRRAAAVLALGGVPFAVLAGALGVYPLADRLALWLVPLAALSLAAAVPVSGAPWQRFAIGSVLAAVTLPAALPTLTLLGRVQHVEELRPVLRQVRATMQPGDLVLVDIAAQAAFDHYAPALGVPRDGVMLFRTVPAGADCGEDLLALRAGRFGNGRVWIIFSHHLVDSRALGTRADLLGRVGTVTRLVRTVRAPGAEAVLLSPRTGEGRPIPPARRTPHRCLVVNRSERTRAVVGPPVGPLVVPGTRSSSG